MNIFNRSGRSGTIAALAVSALLAAPTTALAETALRESYRYGDGICSIWIYPSLSNCATCRL